MIYVPELANGDDVQNIEHLLDLCFALGRRTKTSYRLREGNVAVEELSMVTRDDDLGIVGSISYWPLVIGKSFKPALLLGPLAVHPQRQNLGIGRTLMRVTLEKAKSIGHDLVLLVGDAPYYARLGFKQVPPELMLLPGPWDPARFMYLELQDSALQGADGLVLPAHRQKDLSTAFSVP